MSRKGSKALVLVSLLTVWLFASAVATGRSLASPEPIVFVTPDVLEVEVEEAFEVHIMVAEMVELYTLEFRLSWNAALLNVIGIVEGDFFVARGETLFLNQTVPEEGYMRVGCTLLGNVTGVSGSGIIASIELLALAPGITLLDISETTYEEFDGNVTISGPSQPALEKKKDALVGGEGPVDAASDPLFTVRGPGTTFPTLQAAINAAANGDTIHVYAGVDGPTIVWKSLTIIGQGTGITTINGGGAHALIISANNVVIKEFSIINGNGGVVCLPTANRVTISNNIIANNTAGVVLWRSTADTVEGNFPIGNNSCGVLLWGSTNGLVRANNITNNVSVGIQVILAANGNVYYNNFDNPTNAWPLIGLVVWDDGSAHGVFKGNWWFPATAPRPPDRGPLLGPWWWCPGDINFDAAVNILDVAKAAIAFGSGWSNIRWDPKADVDNNNVVNILDIATIAIWFGWVDP